MRCLLCGRRAHRAIMARGVDANRPPAGRSAERSPRFAEAFGQACRGSAALEPRRAPRRAAARPRGRARRPRARRLRSARGSAPRAPVRPRRRRAAARRRRPRPRAAPRCAAPRCGHHRADPLLELGRAALELGGDGAPWRCARRRPRSARRERLGMARRASPAAAAPASMASAPPSPERRASRSRARPASAGRRRRARRRARPLLLQRVEGARELGRRRRLGAAVMARGSCAARSPRGSPASARRRSPTIARCKLALVAHLAPASASTTLAASSPPDGPLDLGRRRSVDSAPAGLTAAAASRRLPLCHLTRRSPPQRPREPRCGRALRLRVASLEPGLRIGQPAGDVALGLGGEFARRARRCERRHGGGSRRHDSRPPRLPARPGGRRASARIRASMPARPPAIAARSSPRARSTSTARTLAGVGEAARGDRLGGCTGIANGCSVELIEPLRRRRDLRPGGCRELPTGRLTLGLDLAAQLRRGFLQGGGELARRSAGGDRTPRH